MKIVNTDMMIRCVELTERLSTFINTNKYFDPLYEYRLWWDNQGINSETENGWPKEFCFDENNIKKFEEYWSG